MQHRAAATAAPLHPPTPAAPPLPSDTKRPPSSRPASHSLTRRAMTSSAQARGPPPCLRCGRWWACIWISSSDRAPTLGLGRLGAEKQVCCSSRVLCMAVCLFGGRCQGVAIGALALSASWIGVKEMSDSVPCSGYHSMRCDRERLATPDHLPAAALRLRDEH